MIDSNLENLGEAVAVSGEMAAFENELRPTTFGDYIGQKDVKRNLDIAITAAKKRGDILDHVLLHGPPGLGKTTLASIIANSFGVNIKVTSGPALEKQGDVASIVSNLEEGDILFIDEIHRLRTSVEEVLYTAMEDFCIDIIIGKGPSARNMRLNLPKFTLIGATTKYSMLSSPLRSRFGNVLKLQFYDAAEISEIVKRSAKILDCNINTRAADYLAQCARRTPRIANRLLRRVRDFAEVQDAAVIEARLVEEAMGSMGIDFMGLEQTDREILKTLIENFSGGPVGLSTLAAAVCEEKDTIEDIYEPFLIQLGFLERTPRGRKVTDSAYAHLGL